MNALVLFAKFPEAGTVKKKIGRVIGMENSARLCESFIKDIIDKNKDRDYDLYLSFIGHEHKEQYRTMFPHAILYVQRGMNLGENLSCTFEDLLDDYEKVVIIGCDVPDLPSAMIIKAFNALSSYDVVLGPAEDGGYYLIGMKKAHDLFKELHFGTERLLDEQVRAVKDKGMTFVLLDELPDVDTVEELKHLKKTLKREDAPRTYDFIKGIKLD
ncbi:TIGR04282 family arsenosugar biosynthesis glycosyltransferase [Candidatus Woesearchaeota archaeon]|nr:TIGR04282 family arsenosugar biosynthesis glycosyltransferase [Candidatus Woesearchaeota archaeon]